MLYECTCCLIVACNQQWVHWKVPAHVEEAYVLNTRAGTGQQSWGMRAKGLRVYVPLRELDSMMKHYWGEAGEAASLVGGYLKKGDLAGHAGEGGLLDAGLVNRLKAGRAIKTITAVGRHNYGSSALQHYELIAE